MGAIFNEFLIFPQANGPDVELVVNGDEFYNRHETVDGFTVIYDDDLGLYCYADLIDGEFVSTGTPLTKQPPTGLARHLKEAPDVRNAKFGARYDELRPKRPGAGVTLGANRGLLPGRRVSLGTVRGLTVLVEFADLQSSVTVADVEAMLNGPNYTANGNFSSVRDFFLTVSSGKLDYSNVVVGPIRLSQNQAFYKQTLFVKEVMDAVAAQLGNDFSRFDSKGERVIDAINFMYAGRTLYEGSLWPHNADIRLQYGAYRTHTYMLTSMGRSRVDLSIGTFCHESGHLLCRFPDMYDYGERDGDFEASRGIGDYCLMGSGNHLDRGRTPSPVCGYLRALAGWTSNEVIVNGSGRFEAKHGDYATVLKYETDRSNEYFILENRSRLGLDKSLPSAGLAVYHCDTSGSNEWQGGTPTRHYQCGLLQADGREDLERNANGGDPGDLFADRPGPVLTHQSSPSSRVWAGSDSGLLIGDVSATGPIMNFQVGAVAAGTVVNGEVTADQLIPDNLPEGIKSDLAIDVAGKVKSLKPRVSIIHTFIGDLQVELVSPGGRRVMLHDKAGRDQDDLKVTWDSNSFPALATLAGENIRGTWSLLVRDTARRDTGRLNWWGIEIDYEPELQDNSGSAQPNLAIPDADPSGIESVIAMTGSGAVAGISVTVAIKHSYQGDLIVDLVSPAGRSANLHNQAGGSKDDLRMSYDSSSTPALTALLGEPVQGDWRLRVRDTARIDTGVLESWSLSLRA